MIPIHFSAETEAARQAGTAMVALESTLISHGLPHPDNIDVARQAEAMSQTVAVRDTTFSALSLRAKTEKPVHYIGFLGS